MSAVPAGPWVREPRRVHFPVEAEVPESKEHMELRTALYLIVRAAFADRAVLGSDQFVYWDPTDPGACVAPDVFVQLGGPDEVFETWKVWERGAPDVAVEIVSRSDVGDVPWAVKLERHRRLGVKELVRFDPSDAERPLRVWDHVDGDLVERVAGDPRSAASGPLGLFWVVHSEARRRWLRLAEDAAGTRLLPTPGEETVRAWQAAAAAREEAVEAREEATAAHRRIAELEAELARRR